MSSLYELTIDFKKLSEMEFDENSTEQVEEIKEIIKGEIETKGTNIIAVIRNLETDIEGIKKEIERLNKLKKTKENKIKNLKNYTIECLNELELKKVETTLGNISVRKNRCSVVIDDENSIDKKFIKEVISHTVNKEELRKALETGQDVKGAYLKSTESLIIK